MTISVLESTATENVTSSSKDLPQKSFSAVTKVTKVTPIDQDEPLPSFYSLLTDELDNKTQRKQTFTSSLDDEKTKEENPELALHTPPCPYTPRIQEPIKNSSSIKVEKYSLNTEIVTLIEKLGAEMILMTSEDANHTTIRLGDNYPQGSVLNNLEISIQEFSTAPKIFNVTLTSTPESLEKISPYINQLLNVFRERKFDFSINRIETEISSGKPLFCRKKESENDSHTDQQGSRKQ